MNNEIKDFIIKYCKKYPKAEITDLLKALHQSTFGCGHLVSERAYDYLLEEIESFVIMNETIVALPGSYSRLHLEYAIALGLSPRTIYKIFEISSKENIDTVEVLESKLLELLSLSKSGEIPYKYEDCLSGINQWKNDSYCMCRHSDIYRDTYKPAYRVISNKLIPYLELFARIDQLYNSEDSVVLAIEGGSASGKTTLSALLSKVYDCNVFHMDDFFLQPHQRTKERLMEPGGNVDRERFLEEVLIPLKEKREVQYKRFDCEIQKIVPAEIKPLKKINVIEGAYCMHPDLSHHYNISVFLEIDSKCQIERIQKRNTEELQQRFFNEWIPMEQIYFKAFNIDKSCDFVVNNNF